MPAAYTVTLVDEQPGGTRSAPARLQLVRERITLRELIQRRVEAEVVAYNASTPEYFSGLVQPTDAERTLNGYRMRARRRLDADKQVASALEAFDRNGFFVLFEGRQLEGLDEEIVIGPDAEVRFVKLVPLVGG